MNIIPYVCFPFLVWLMTATGIPPVDGTEPLGAPTDVKISSLNPEVNPVPNCHRNATDFPLPIVGGMGGTLWPGNAVGF